MYANITHSSSVHNTNMENCIEIFNLYKVPLDLDLDCQPYKCSDLLIKSTFIILFLLDKCTTAQRVRNVHNIYYKTSSFNLKKVLNNNNDHVPSKIMSWCNISWSFFCFIIFLPKKISF